MNKQPTLDYAEFVDLNDGYQLEIRAESFEEPIFAARQEVLSRLLIIERLNGESQGIAGLRYYPAQLTDTELKQEVKYVKEDPFQHMYESFTKKYKK